MHRLLILSLLATVLSCKTSDSSKLDTVQWRNLDKILFIHFDKPTDTFIVNSCPVSKPLEKAFIVDKSLEAALKTCNGASTVVTPDALSKAIFAEISAQPQTRIVDAKETYLTAIRQNIDDLNAGLEMLEEDSDDKRPDQITNIQKLRSTVTELEAEHKKITVVLESSKDDKAAVLKKMDMDKTASLYTNTVNATANYAEIFTSMLKDKKNIYNISADRDMTLMDAIKDFSPTCFEGMRTRGEKIVLENNVRRTIQCRPDGAAEVLKVECITSDYVLLQKEGSNLYCEKKIN